MTPTTRPPYAGWSLRLIFVCLAAVSVSLPMAWISLAKLILFVLGLGYLLAGYVNNRSDFSFQRLWTTKTILGILIAFALSLLWTEVSMDFALSMFVKHAKLLGILLLIFLIRTEREARLAIGFLAAGQLFVLIASWVLASGIFPFLHSDSTTNPANRSVVFAESYLDQSIMFATMAAIFWHLAPEKFWPRWLAGLVALAALSNVLLLLPGRTGYLVALAMLSLAAMWALNKRLRLIALIATPLVVVIGLYFSSGQVRERISQVVTEAQSYTKQVETASSSGWRLNAWRRSVQAMYEKPWNGYGVGSWTPAVKRMEGDTATQTFGVSNSSNQHQEYLLWGVELGVGGPLLLVALLVAVIRDTRFFPAAVARATLSILAGVAIACLFNSALFDDLMGDYLCISLGLMMALGVRSRSPRQVGWTQMPQPIEGRT
jgi:O-antigen ligase